MSNLPPVERIQALKIEPGDTLIVGLPSGMAFSQNQIEEYRATFRDALGDVPIIFTQGGIELEVVSA